MAGRDLMAIIGRLRNFRHCPRCWLKHIQKKNYSDLKTSIDLDAPVKYSQTKASKMDTADVFKLRPNPAVLPAEKPIVLITTLVLLIYFSMLRKENKIDKILDGSFDYEEDDEIKILNALLHAKLKGLKTDDLEKKLQIIRASK